MFESVLLVVISAVATWFIMNWVRSKPDAPKPLSHEEKEIGRAKDIGSELAGARDRASLAEVELNKVALAKAVKAALWVTEAGLNVAVPELLTLSQRWAGQSVRRNKKWTPPEGVTRIEGLDDPKQPWAAWTFDDQQWRIEAQWISAIKEIEEDLGTYRVLLNEKVVLDMTISRQERQVMWIDALTVGPWVSDLLTFAGAQTSDATARTSAHSARKNQERADKIHWS